MLRAEGLTKRYRGAKGWFTVLNDVTFELQPGARLGLFGPSGTGKSTLAQILALLLRPDAGRVSVDGQVSPGWGLNAPRALRRQVQLIWQSPRLATDPRLRLREIIVEPLASNGQLPRDRVRRNAILEEWVDRVGLTGELLDRHPHEVSDGQLQRACLARALILRPRYLICDELSSMLDVSTQAALLATIGAEQARRELGVLLISHDRVLIKHWCEQALELGRDAPPIGAGVVRRGGDGPRVGDVGPCSVR
jgi:peptide/nickel transport system ATP-binding protein